MLAEGDSGADRLPRDLPHVEPALSRLDLPGSQPAGPPRLSAGWTSPALSRLEPLPPGSQPDPDDHRRPRNPAQQARTASPCRIRRVKNIDATASFPESRIDGPERLVAFDRWSGGPAGFYAARAMMRIRQRPAMLKTVAILTLLACAACAQKPAEKTYPMTATIVSRDVTQNTVTLDNKDVPGVMEPMRMDYQVRGTNVSTLPKDDTPVQVTLHMTDEGYWVTDIKARK